MKSVQNTTRQAALLCVKFQTAMTDSGDAPLTFPLSDECLPPGLHVQAQVFHHAVDAVVQGQAAGLRLDGLPADGTLVFLFAPLLDAVAAEAVSTVQDDCLDRCRVEMTFIGGGGGLILLCLSVFFCSCSNCPTLSLDLLCLYVTPIHLNAEQT